MTIYIVCVLLVVSILLLNFIYKGTPYYQEQYQRICKFQKGVPQKLDIVNTGSNHAYFSIDWSLAGVNGFSLASGSQSICWDYRLLKKYQHHVKPNGYVLIVLSNLLLGFLDYADDRMNKRYYYFMSAQEIPDYSWWKNLKYHVLPVLENWRNFIHCFYHRGKMAEECASTLSYCEAQSDARIAGWKRQFSLPDLEHQESAVHLEQTIQQAVLVLRRMVDETRTAGLQPILMVPPLSAIINKKITLEFLDKVLYQPVHDVASDVPLLDYLHDERFQDYHLYQNGDFMNEAGRRAFMPVLWNDIQNCTKVKQL